MMTTTTKRMPFIITRTIRKIVTRLWIWGIIYVAISLSSLLWPSSQTTTINIVNGFILSPPSTISRFRISVRTASSSSSSSSLFEKSIIVKRSSSSSLLAAAANHNNNNNHNNKKLQSEFKDIDIDDVMSQVEMALQIADTVLTPSEESESESVSSSSFGEEADDEGKNDESSSSDDDDDDDDDESIILTADVFSSDMYDDSTTSSSSSLSSSSSSSTDETVQGNLPVKSAEKEPTVDDDASIPSSITSTANVGRSILEDARNVNTSIRTPPTPPPPTTTTTRNLVTKPRPNPTTAGLGGMSTTNSIKPIPNKLPPNPMMATTASSRPITGRSKVFPYPPTSPTESPPPPPPGSYTKNTSSTSDDTIPRTKVQPFFVMDAKENSTKSLKSTLSSSSSSSSPSPISSVDVTTEDIPVNVEEQMEPPSPPPPSPLPPPVPPSPSKLEKVMKEVPNIVKDEKVEEFLGAVRDITVDASTSLFQGLRWGVANVLTKDMPTNDREQLLTRMMREADDGSDTVEAVGTKQDGDREDNDDEEDDEEDEDDEFESRGSVQEEIAVAVREEARKNQEQWELERESITKKIQEAAEQRMATELEIQKNRLKKEKDEYQLQLKDSMSRRDLQLEELQKATVARENELRNLRTKLQSYELIQKESEDAIAKAEQSDDPAAVQEEKYRLQAVATLLEKRKQQQLELETVEAELRAQAKEIQAEKERMEKDRAEIEQSRQQLEQEASAPAASPVPATAAKEGSQNEIPHLSPKEYRALSQEEKFQLKIERARQAAATAAAATTAGAVSEDETSAPKVGDDGSDGEERTKAVPSNHPILGPVVADLGYKRVHLVSSGRLGTLPIWNKQRVYNNQRARSMAHEKSKTMQLGFPGIICLHEDSYGKLSIIDGQHRIGMLQALREQYKMAQAAGNTTSPLFSVDDDTFNKILVEVYSQPKAQDGEGDDTTSKEQRETANRKHAESVFLEINKAEPVKLVDMPGVASSKERRIITGAVNDLKEQYPKMFSPSQRCRTPNVNVDNLRNALFGANVLQRHKLTSAKQLLDWLVEKNASQGTKYETDPEKQDLISPKAFAKASNLGFYLGLDSSWLYT